RGPTSTIRLEPLVDGVEVAAEEIVHWPPCWPITATRPPTGQGGPLQKGDPRQACLLLRHDPFGSPHAEAACSYRRRREQSRSTARRRRTRSQWHSLAGELV